MADGKCTEHSQCCKGPSNVFTQTLKELDFSRGIWSAAVDGDESRVTTLLDQGTSPNSRDTSGYSPLHYASRHGHYSLVELLLNRGAIVNSKTPSNTTPLHRAVYSCHSNVVKLLLQKGADPSISDSDGMTALHKAIEGGNADIINLIISTDSSLLSVPNNKGQLPKDLIKDSLLLIQINIK